MSPEEMLARLLYRDGLMLIIDKPAGIPVHAGPGGGPNLEQDLDALRFGLPSPPGLAHRLDRDTSGCLVLGRQRKGLSRLGKLFAAGAVEKTYWAVTVGQPASPEGRIELPLRKASNRAGWKMVADAEGQHGGQSAVTEYRVLGSGDGLAWIEAKPRTGRTHQIRVHLAALGAPILGDHQYGDNSPGGRPLHLLARAVVVPLYPKKPPVAVEAPVPAHMRAALLACGWRPD
jgi:tRNA pseudouridine32 synthase/23S rRNA pseudouridine746 synthase/23S rRNA pseudouridine1911/1915/1917 synthase